MNNHYDETGVKSSATVAVGCAFMLGLLLIPTCVFGGVVYLVAVLMFGADLSYIQCCGIGLVLGLILTSGSRG